MIQSYLLLIFFVALLFVSSVRAELNFCNGAPLTIQTSVGKFEEGKWSSEGWWIIKSGECKTVVGGNLPNQYYYAFAETLGGGKWKWNGNNSPAANLFCVNYSQAFEINQGSCDFAVRSFSRIDTGKAKSFNFWFTCSDCTDPRLVNAIRINIPFLEGLANYAVPQYFRTEDWQDIGPVDIQYGVSRSPFQLGIQGNQFYVSVRLSYWLSISHTRFLGIRTGIGSCGIDEPQPIADIKLQTVFGITQEGKITSKTRVSQLSFPTSCKVTMLDFDLTGYVQEAVNHQLDKVISSIDSRIGEIDVSQVLKASDIYK